MTDPAAQDRRERRNETFRRSREKAKATQAAPGWVITHPTLDSGQRATARAFLSGEDAAPDATTRDLLRKHLLASRAVSNDRFKALLRKLDDLDKR